ncbi:MAG: hypothetical protein ABIT58_05785 [Ferruginibacter sp.]
MTKKILSALLFVLILYSCNANKRENPSTAIGAGSSFIRATLDGDFNVAETLILKDTEDLQLFDSYKIYYDRLPAEKKKNYKAANYKINKYVDVNDSTTIINYSNDYMNKPMEIKVVRNNNEWKVDFKYTYSGDSPID